MQNKLLYFCILKIPQKKKTFTREHEISYEIGLFDLFPITLTRLIK